MREDHDVRRDWEYVERGGISDAPLWAPPEMPRARRLAGMGRYYALMALLALVFIVSIGGAVLAFMSSDSDPSALDAEELDQLIAERARVGQTESESNTADGASAPVRATTLNVYSDPPDATVLIDYDSVGVTPLTDHSILPGIYILSVADGPDIRLDTVIVVRESGPEGALSIDLAQRGGSTPASRRELAQGSGESGSTSGRDAQPPARTESPRVAESPAQNPATAGQTPGQSREQTTEQTTEQSDPEESPETNRQQPVRQNPTARFGMLSVSSTPAGAEVQLDGEAVGVTPLHLQNVPPGSRRISIELGDHQPASSVIDVEAGQQASIHETLQPQMGTVTVLVKPWGTIFIDGELHGRDLDVQYVTELPVGQHRITVLHPSLGEREQIVDVRPNTTRQIVIDLTSSAPATSSRQ